MIAAKINLLYSERKNYAIHSHMSKIRHKFVHRHRKQAVYTIISASSQSITPQHLQLLFHFANNAQPEAIIHLGNLLIDHIIPVDLFEKHDFHPSHQAHSIWLLRVLHEKRFFTRAYLEYLFEFVENFQGSFLEEHAFPLLAQILKQKSSTITILLNDHEKCIKVICKYCQGGHPKRAKDSYSILSTVISDSISTTSKLIEIIEFEKLFEIVEDGLARVEVDIRAVCCQIVANLAIDYEIPVKILERILTISGREKQKVMVEISYIFFNLVFYSEKATIVRVLHLGLIPVLGRMAESMHQSILNNISKTVNQISQLLDYFDELDRIFVLRQLAEEETLRRILEQEDIDIEGGYF